MLIPLYRFFQLFSWCYLFYYGIICIYSKNETVEITIWCLSDCNWTQTQNHLVRKQTLANFAKLDKWLSCVLSQYLSVRYIWLYVLVMTRTCFRVNPHSIVAWMSRLNGWRVELLNIRLNPEVFLYELSASGFQSGSSHLNLRFHASFKQGVPWHSGRYRVWIPSETRTWHHKNLQSNALHRQVLRTQLDHLASLTD